jgi:hypothetical protein
MADIQELLRTLARLGVAGSRELAGELGVSQPTLSRLLSRAGEDICRMGRTKGARYARTRTLAGLGARLPIYRITEAGRSEPYGVLTLLQGGRHWQESQGSGALFEGLPPYAADMSPQGYVGRTFHARYPELGLPPRIGDWNDDHRLIALARRGEDCVGDLILGEESLNRFLESKLDPVERSDYPELARRSAQGHPGSSAGGEQPKFLTYSQGRHVLVKFVTHDEGAAARRWMDLLVCENLALEIIREAGLEAAVARCFTEGSFRFLEVERFDRIGARGRRGVLSLAALDNEYIGSGTSWTQVASHLLALGRIDAEDARRVRWLDAFGQLIGNTDRHLGNLSLLVAGDGRLRIAPIYDMLPMLFAPAGTLVMDRDFVPAPPTAGTLDVWADAARHAHRYWRRLVDCDELSAGFRDLSRRCLQRLEDLRERVPI